MQARSGSQRLQGEIVPVGEAYCLFRADNHAVALLNRSGAEFCTQLISSVDHVLEGSSSRADHAACLDTRTLLAQLADAGFLGDVSSELADTAGQSSEALAQFNPVVQSSTYRIGQGRAVRLSSNDEWLLRLLQAVLALLAADRTIAASGHVHIESDDRGYHCWRDGVAVRSGIDRARIRRFAIEMLLAELLAPARLGAILHASAVATEGGAVLMVGRTGSGKSTLAAAMAASGYDYVADDFVALDVGGLAVHAFPAAVSLKEPSWAVLGQALPELAAAKTFEVGPRRVRYVDPVTAGRRAAGLVRPALIVFPRYDASAIGVCSQALAPEEVLARMLDAGSQVVASCGSIRPLVRLASAISAVEIVYRDHRDAMREIAGQLCR